MTQFDGTSNISALIKARSDGRFSCANAGAEIDEFTALKGEGIAKCQVFFLRRLERPIAGRRTLLVASITNKQAIPIAVSWAAQVRSALPEPEAADLFLFLLAEEISDDIAARVEADEQFCRKYVKRKGESVAAMLDRSFLASIYTPVTVGAGDETLALLGDPLSNAFVFTSKDHAWFDAKQQHLWRQTLLSGSTGSDVVDVLIAPIDEETAAP
jgi:hypothetical protein